MALDLEAKMKLRKLALEGGEWALDMLLCDVELAAAADALNRLRQQFDGALAKAVALSEAHALPQKSAGA